MKQKDSKKMYRNKLKNNTGVTLIELLVSMVLGLVVAGAALELFTSNKQTYRLEGYLSDLQDTGRFIMKTMTEEIRMGAYNGCTSRDNDFRINDLTIDPAPYDLGMTNGLNGSDAIDDSNWGPALPAMLNAAGQVTAETDTVTVQRTEECSAILSANSDTSGSLTLYADHGCSIEQNSPVFVTDCSTAEIFQVEDGAPTTTLTYGGAGNLNFTYESDSTEVRRIFSTTFSVAPSVIAPGETSLWMYTWNPDNDGASNLVNDFQSSEIALGVEDLQVLYGVADDDGDDDYVTNYVTADAVADWSLVKSVRFSVLLYSDDEATSQPRGINFNGALVNDPDEAGADRRLRMAFTSTVSLRNRIQ